VTIYGAAHRSNATDFVDSRPDNSEIESISAPDVPVKNVTDVKTKIYGSNRLPLPFAPIIN
jgi:hypothetical protein